MQDAYQDSYRPTGTVKMLIIFIALLAVFAAGLAVGAKYDLVIDQALLPIWQQASADHAAGQFSFWYWLAILTESLGVLPAYAVGAVLGWCLVVGSRRGRAQQRMPRLIAGVVLTLAGCIAMTYTAFEYLDKRDVYASGLDWWVLSGVLLAAAVVAWAMLSRIGAPKLRAWRTLSLFWLGMSVVQYAIIHIIKPILQRTRFDDMLAVGSFEDFTPWTALPGNGGSSFPSGHTGSAGVLIVLLVACRLFDSCRGDEAGFLFLGYGATLTVAFGRMLIGRHYLSDTMISLVIDTVLVMVIWFVPVLKRAALAGAESEWGSVAAPAGDSEVNGGAEA